ncbi:MAG: histidinol-phosphate transaminase [Candidatus Methanomethylicota archaeon]|uniref:histidinol-phosphate transaminase n=1 Tax=Thermoproteota archaeon TaxID=2056631 RepID=A0A497ETV6_9CREN|nr:MAG: histidinol-phosphate transaminase [Candidatus Verstraetearchaeota archaeon]
MKIEDLVCRGVRALASHKKTEITETYDKMSLFEKAVRMDLNENFLIEEELVKWVLRYVGEHLDPRRYPPAKGIKAVKALSSLTGLDEANLAVGNGADELIERLVNVFVGDDRALVIEPTFEMYEFYITRRGGVKVSCLVNDDLCISADEILRAVNGVKAVFICSPNNPTGIQYDFEEVLRVVENFKGLVVVDEAYVDFAGKSLCERAPDYDNLVILRTLSKAYGLAGLRVGYMVASDDIIKWVKVAEPPFNVNAAAQYAVEAIALRADDFKRCIAKVKEEREYLYSQLTKLDGVKPFKSSANFIMLKVVKEGWNSSKLVNALLNKGVAVRDRGNLPKIENCIRVTVGTRDMNNLFLNALKEVLHGS